MTDAANWAPLQAGHECLFVPGEKRREGCRIKPVSHGKIGVAELCKFVPRTTELAVVTAIDAIADQGSQFDRDCASQFDGQVRDAAAGVDFVGRDDGGSRAGFKASAAGTAVFADRLVRRKR